MPRKPNNQEITNTVLDLQLKTLADKVDVGFKGIHDRQDTLNGKVLESQKDIGNLRTAHAVLQTQFNNSKIIWYLFTAALGLALTFGSYLIMN